MKPPGPVSLVTRMQVFSVFVAQLEASPVDVVPTTICWLCAAPAGTSAGPPLSPSQTPGVSEDPPWLDWRMVLVSWRLTGAVPVLRPLLLLLVSVSPKPTCSTSTPSESPSCPGWATGITAAFAGAANLSMQKS